jgi:hypothetical protein
MEEPAPPEPFSKRVVDPVNSVTWFLMDAFWMLDLAELAYGFTLLTLLTGLWLLVASWREKGGERLAGLGLSCWIVMNAVWLVYDLNDYNGGKPPLPFAAPIAALGVLFLLAATWKSQDVRRARVLKR